VEFMTMNIIWSLACPSQRQQIDSTIGGLFIFKVPH